MLERIRKRIRRLIGKLKLMYVLEMDIDNGALYLADTRLMLPPALALSATRDRIQDIGPAGQRFLYETGKDAGRQYASSIEQIMGRELQPEDFADLCAEYAAYTGWGHQEIKKMDFEKDEYVVTVQNTPFRNDRDEKTGEYHAGMFAGAGEYILGFDVDAKEIECENAGADRCVFMVKISERFDSLF